jgi:hypothetical protein
MMKHTGLSGTLRAVGWGVVLLMAVALLYATGIVVTYWADIKV